MFLRWLNIGVCAAVLLVLFLLLMPALEQSRQQARQAQSRNQMKQLGIRDLAQRRGDAEGEKERNSLVVNSGYRML